MYRFFVTLVVTALLVAGSFSDLSLGAEDRATTAVSGERAATPAVFYEQQMSTRASPCFEPATCQRVPAYPTIGKEGHSVLVLSGKC